MGILHQLWDDTLAGPAPETGLGKLRKYKSFSATRSTAAPSADMVSPKHDNEHQIPITRSITMVRRDVRRDLSISVGSPSEPSSPVGSSAPSSPFSPNSPGGNFKKWNWTKRKPASGGVHNSEPESKNGCDWIVILNSLDR